MSATLVEQFEGYVACCLKLARSAKTAAGRARFLQMAHEYRLATLRVRQEELSSDQKVDNADKCSARPASGAKEHHERAAEARQCRA